MKLQALAFTFANTFLLWLGYYWLGIGESRGTMLAWSVMVALAIVLLACWTYGAAFAFFEPRAEGRPRAAWRIALSHLIPLMVCGLAAAAIYFLLARWADYSSKPALQTASYLTLKFRKPVSPATVMRILNTALWLVRWMLLPVLFLPMIAAIAGRGWSGFRALGAFRGKWMYWLEVPVLLYAATAVPLKLFGWVPNVNGFGMELVSLILRAGLAYLLFLGAWLALAFVTSGGSPRLTQPNSVASP